MDLEERKNNLENLDIPSDIFKFKTKRSNRRMKIYIKLTKDETKHWDELKKAAKPDHITDDEFARVLFFQGMNNFMEQLMERINNMPEEEKERILAEKEGLKSVETVSEDTQDENSNEDN